MTLSPELLAILRCPRCRQGMRYGASRTPRSGAAEFGTLTCGCGAYPVIDGIPILLREPVGMFLHAGGELVAGGSTPSRLVGLIRSGRASEALTRCLSYPRAGRGRAGGPARRGEAAHAAGPADRGRVRADLLARRQRLSATDVLRFFFHARSPLGTHLGDYFVMRFGQPRFLAALALLRTVPPGARPLLDIACGAGHFEHYLTRRRERVPAIGVDKNFFELWIARHWIAPRAHFVCCDVQDGLPFADDVFSATFCSDAYHYLRDRRGLLREVRRCAPGGMGILARVGNGAVAPNEGAELDPSGYVEEIAEGTLRMFDEATLVRDYLARRDPFASPPGDAAETSRSKWLSFAWNAPPEARRTPPDEDGQWPHAVGRLAWNPIYARRRGAGGTLELRFAFPGIWFAYENAGMLEYHPRSVTLTRSDLERLRSGAADPLVAELLRRFVLVGLPERYGGAFAP